MGRLGVKEHTPVGGNQAHLEITEATPRIRPSEQREGGCWNVKQRHKQLCGRSEPHQHKAATPSDQRQQEHGKEPGIQIVPVAVRAPPSCQEWIGKQDRSSKQDRGSNDRGIAGAANVHMNTMLDKRDLGNGG